ncbi:VanZ family protein [Cellulosimicrobium cellulans]|uniref:VanZ family protein n=1 Tax=Cellulosimicrobium cellulans TaxID=1710 RepID=UPI0020CB8BFD|nr:VanZ family protein [Cellulosimicrobium cellulans]
MFREVPVLPVVVPLGAVVLGLLLWRLHRSGRLTLPRAAVALALAVYAAGVVANTVFPIFLDKPASSAAWDAHLVLVPLVEYEVVDALTNVLVFVPLGMLVPLLLARTSWWRVVVAAAAFSLAIEVTQYVTSHLLGGGHIADASDLLFNVVGGVLGFALFTLLSRVPALDAFFDRFRWSAAPRPGGSRGSRGSRADGTDARRARSAVEL